MRKLLFYGQIVIVDQAEFISLAVYVKLFLADNEVFDVIFDALVRLTIVDFSLLTHNAKLIV